MSNDNRMNIAYIGGGSCHLGWRLLPELADEDITAMVKLYDTEKSAALANEVIGNRIRESRPTRGDIIYLACDTAEEALRDADYVIFAINPGTIEELVTELHLPETYGIYQSSGENSGLCGIIHALKILPVCIDYAEKIKELCPNAWVINASCPMAEVITIMKHFFPEMKLVGAMSDTFAAQQLLVNMLCDKNHRTDIRRRSVKTSLIGISGFSWFSDVFWEGESLMPLFREYAEKYYDNGYEVRLNEFKTNPDADAHRIKFDLFLRYGFIPAVSDRCAAEFCGSWYLKSLKIMSSWRFSPMTSGYRKKIYTDKIGRVKRYMSGDQLPSSVDTTDIPAIIRALSGGGNLITGVSMPNCGQVENLPAGTVVDTNALISKNSVRPVCEGRLPEEIYCLSIRPAVNRQTVVRAVLERDLDIAFNAFLNDPVMSADLASATELYREMLAAVRTHLVYYCS